MSVSGRDPDAQGPTPIDLLQARIRELEAALRSARQTLIDGDGFDVELRKIDSALEKDAK